MMLRLLDHLMRENAQLQDFMATLEAEYAAMQTGNFADLPALSERKTDCLAQIAQLDAWRDQEQRNLGYSPDQAGADALAQSGGPALQHAWEQLQRSAQQAREGNLRNGVLVHTHLDFTRQAIGFLKPGSQSLYGPDGAHARHGGPGHALGRG